MVVQKFLIGTPTRRHTRVTVPREFLAEYGISANVNYPLIFQDDKTGASHRCGQANIYLDGRQWVMTGLKEVFEIFGTDEPQVLLFSAERDSSASVVIVVARPPLRELCSQAWRILSRQVQHQRTLTVSQMRAKFDAFLARQRWHLHGHHLKACLSPIDEYCAREQLPPLTSIIASSTSSKRAQSLFSVWVNRADPFSGTPSGQADLDESTSRAPVVEAIETRGEKAVLPAPESDAASENASPPVDRADFEHDSDGLSGADGSTALGAMLSAEESYFPGEFSPTETYHEGASVRVMVNRYERSPEAREQCIAHHGGACAVCAFSFESTYGELGEGFIHVHHIVSISKVGVDYKVDPIKDLVPLCPNCHAMIHRRTPPLTVEKLRSIMRDRQSGSSVSV